MGFASIGFLIGTGTATGWINDEVSGWPSWFTGTCWDTTIPNFSTNLHIYVCYNDPIPTFVRPLVTVGLLLFLAVAIIGAVKAFVGFTGNVGAQD